MKCREFCLLGRRHAFVALGLACVSLLASTNQSRSADVSATWLGGAGPWSDPLQWSSNPNYPNNGNGGFTYDATVNSGTATLDQSVAIQALTLGGGTINGSSNLILNGTSNWSVGTMSGAGTTTIASGGVLNLTGDGVVRNLNRNLTNNGTVNWTGGSGLAMSAVTFQNNGTLHFGAGGSFPGISGSSGTFNNAGSIVKQTSNVGAINTILNNSGLVDVQGGQMNFFGGGSHTGQFQVSAGSRITFAAGSNFSAGSTLAGTGEILLADGVYEFDNSSPIDNITVDHTILDGGTLRMSSAENLNAITLTNNGTLDHVINVDVNGTLTVNRGTLRGAGRTDANANHVINGLFDIRTGHQFRSLGNGTVKPNKELSIYSGGRWDIMAGSTVDFQGSSTISSPDNTGKVLNNGTITKTSDGVTHVSPEFENDGVLHVKDMARWSMHADGNHGGQFILDAASGLRLHDSTHTFLPTSQITGPGELQLTQGSTAVIQGNLDVAVILIDDDSTLDMQVDGAVGTLEFTDGAITGAGELTITDSIQFYGDASLNTDLRTGNSNGDPLDIHNHQPGSLTIGVLGNIGPTLGEAIGSLENDGTITRAGGGETKVELKVKNKGTIKINGDSGLQLPADFQQESGQLIVDGSVIFGSAAQVNGGKVSGNGTINMPPSPPGGGPAPPFGICVSLGGCSVNPGASPGHLSIVGGTEFGLNTLFEAEISGTMQGTTYDLLSVTGEAHLNGVLKVVLLDGFAPTLNNEFEVLTAGTIVGQFSSAQLPALAPGLRWDVQYDAQSVTLVVAAGIAGDFNHDGAVNAADYVVWRKGNGSAADYNLWRSNFGAQGSGDSALAGDELNRTSVPEPQSLLLAFASLATLVTLQNSRLRGAGSCRR